MEIGVFIYWNGENHATTHWKFSKARFGTKVSGRVGWSGVGWGRRTKVGEYGDVVMTCLRGVNCEGFGVWYRDVGI